MLSRNPVRRPPIFKPTRDRSVASNAHPAIWNNGSHVIIIDIPRDIAKAAHTMAR